MENKEAMIIYLATGFTVMNVPGKEKELLEKFGKLNRLISFHDTIIGNNIFQVIDLKKELDRSNRKKK